MSQLPDARPSDRAASTRAHLLDAAREVFSAAGFTDAAIADVVARAGASVGSLYHHFGGKGDLYLALFDDYEARQEGRAAAAVHEAKLGGEVDAITLFVVGARAYLRGCWEERDLARLFLAGGGPAGFELVARRRYREWTRLNHALLHPADDPRADCWCWCSPQSSVRPGGRSRCRRTSRRPCVWLRTFSDLSPRLAPTKPAWSNTVGW